MAHIPQRMCVACRKMQPQGELIRFVHTEDGVKIDMNKKLFGRGAYICKNVACVKLAKKKRGIERHFKCAVPNEIYEEAEKLV